MCRKLSYCCILAILVALSALPAAARAQAPTPFRGTVANWTDVERFDAGDGHFLSEEITLNVTDPTTLAAQLILCKTTGDPATWSVCSDYALLISNACTGSTILAQGASVVNGVITILTFRGCSPPATGRCVAGSWYQDGAAHVADSLFKKSPAQCKP